MSKLCGDCFIATGNPECNCEAPVSGKGEGVTKYPENDKQFEEVEIKSVSESGSSFVIERSDGFCFYVGDNPPFKPEPGMLARFYGKGIGSPVRGLFIDGKKFFYRDEAEYSEHSDIQSYGKDAADWLSRWDKGKSVWTIEMGGLGPGYEQCIQITTAEILRIMLDKKYQHEFWEDADLWKKDREEIEAHVFKNKTVNALGLSGAQFGAALGLAARLYMRGPVAVMSDPQIKSRKIQASKQFPGVAL